MKKLLSIHVMTSSKFTNTRQKNCIETWLDGFDDYIFLTDNINGNYKQISNSKNPDYSSCTEKQITEINRIIQNKLYENYEWFFFCDDDIVLNINTLKELIKTPKLLIDRIVKDPKGWENRNNVLPDISSIDPLNGVWGSLASLGPGSIYPSGGAGFLIHSNIFKNCKHLGKLNSEFADVAVGNWMKENNIPLYWLNGVTGCSPNETGIDPRNKNHHDIIRKEWITFHRIHNYETMKLFDDIWKNKI